MQSYSWLNQMLLTDYRLIWQDEFDNINLDTTKWYMWGNPGIAIENSSVKIGPEKGGIQTGMSGYNSKFSFKYPTYIEFRAKLAGTGNENSYASQLWLYEEGIVNKDEIDLVETSSGPISLTGRRGRNKINTAIHCPTMNDYINITYDTNTDLSDNYHLYAVEWTQDYVKCFFDDIEYANLVPTPTVCIPQNFMYIVLTLCKKTYLDRPEDCFPSDVLPSMDAWLYIDYVRVYEKYCNEMTCNFTIN